MSNIPSTGWNPEQDLATLLDALAEELLAAPDRQVAACLGGPEEQTLVQDMRRLVAAAEADLMVPPVSDFIAQRFRDYVTRKQ